LLGLPLSWLYIQERGTVRDKAAPVSLSGSTWQQGMRAYSFWIIVAALFLGAISMNGAITHLSALLTDRGIPPGEAALCAAILGGASVVGRVVTGWLLDRFFGGWVGFVITLITAGGMFLLARTGSLAGALLAAALIGIGAGGEAAITPY